MEAVGYNRLKVLVADSQPATRAILASALRGIGLASFEASDAEETIDILCSVEIHGLVLDNELPELGGLETIRVVRTFHKAPPYLLLVRALTHDLQMAALDERATSVLPKPVDASVFSEIVRTMLFRQYGRVW